MLFFLALDHAGEIGTVLGCVSSPVMAYIMSTDSFTEPVISTLRFLHDGSTGDLIPVNVGAAQPLLNPCSHQSVMDLTPSGMRARASADSAL